MTHKPSDVFRDITRRGRLQESDAKEPVLPKELQKEIDRYRKMRGKEIVTLQNLRHVQVAMEKVTVEINDISRKCSELATKLSSKSTPASAKSTLAQELKSCTEERNNLKRALESLRREVDYLMDDLKGALDV